jgi:endoglycosylceramidase
VLEAGSGGIRATGRVGPLLLSVLLLWSAGQSPALGQTSLSRPEPNASPLAGAIEGPVRVVSGRFVDADNRVVSFHGLFAAWKVPGGLPPDSATAPDGFTAADAAEAASLGMDVFRLAWFWADLEPSPGHVDHAYLNGYVRLARMLEGHGIQVLVDAHQDMFSPRFGGDGFPDWAAPPDDLDPHPAPFPHGYLTPPVAKAFDAFWSDDRHVQQAFQQAWEEVARRFSHDPHVVGYDLMNEPFPGSNFGSCLASPGCPSFDHSVLQKAESRLGLAVREVDGSHPLFLEPLIFFDWGVPTGLSHTRSQLYPLGLSFHDECFERAVWEGSGGTTTPTPQQEATCLAQSTAPITNGEATASAMRAAPFMTEVSSITNSDAAGLECILEDGEAHQLSWTYGLNWKAGELRHLDPLKAAVLARAYPVAVAGVPSSYGFDPRTATFQLSYRVSYGPHRARGDTVVFLPTSIYYPGGYHLQVSGARVVSPPGSPRLLLANDQDTRSVQLEVTPAGPTPSPASSLPACANLVGPGA